MSAVKIFALSVLVTGALASSTLAGSIRNPVHTRDHAERRITGVIAPHSTPVAPAAQMANWSTTPVIAAANLAGGSADPGSSNSGGGFTAQAAGFGNQSGGLVLNMSGSTAAVFQGISYVGNNPTPTPTPTPTPAPTPPTPAQADAFINFGNGPFLEAQTLTTGTPQSFTTSPVFTHLFPNGPTSQNVTDFENQVLATIQKTYSDANLPLHLTTDPGVSAAHTLSLVSGVSNPQNPGAIGITAVGNNGFSFIDKFATITDPTQLATAIGHNLAHEMMHAFGLANHPETDGPYIDAARTTVASLTDPSTDFSPAAATLLSTLNFHDVGDSILSGAQQIDGAQVLVGPGGASVPEPSAVALWGALAGIAGIVRHRRKSA